MSECVEFTYLHIVYEQKNRNFGSSLFHIKPSVKVKLKIVKLLMYVDRKKRTGNKPKLTSYFCLLLIGFAKDV